MKNIRAVAAMLLAKKSFFCSEFKKKLLLKGFEEPLVDETIEFFKKLGALQDDDLQKNLETSALRKGRCFFYRQGAVHRFECTEIEEKHAIEAIIEKKRKGTFDVQERQRLYRLLMRRGFDHELIKQVLKKITCTP